jgi:hypothetical protein
MNIILNELVHWEKETRNSSSFSVSSSNKWPYHVYYFTTELRTMNGIKLYVTYARDE